MPETVVTLPAVTVTATRVNFSWQVDFRPYRFEWNGEEMERVEGGIIGELIETIAQHPVNPVPPEDPNKIVKIVESKPTWVAGQLVTQKTWIKADGTQQSHNIVLDRYGNQYASFGSSWVKNAPNSSDWFPSSSPPQYWPSDPGMGQDKVY